MVFYKPINQCQLYPSENQPVRDETHFNDHALILTNQQSRPSNQSSADDTNLLTLPKSHNPSISCFKTKQTNKKLIKIMYAQQFALCRDRRPGHNSLLL